MTIAHFEKDGIVIEVTPCCEAGEKFVAGLRRMSQAAAFDLARKHEGEYVWVIVANFATV